MHGGGRDQLPVQIPVQQVQGQDRMIEDVKKFELSSQDTEVDVEEAQLPAFQLTTQEELVRQEQRQGLDPKEEVKADPDPDPEVVLHNRVEGESTAEAVVILEQEKVEDVLLEKEATVPTKEESDMEVAKENIASQDRVDKESGQGGARQKEELACRRRAVQQSRAPAQGESPGWDSIPPIP